MNAKRRAASLLLGIVLAACANTPTSPTSAPKPEPDHHAWPDRAY